MEQGRRRIDRITAEGYLDGIGEWPMPELRARRDETKEEESLLSYERRVLHAKISIVDRAATRRRSGESGSLIDDLKEILSDGSVGGGRGGANLADPQIRFDKPSRPTTKLAMDDTLTKLEDLDSDQLRAYGEQLREAEREVSAQRAIVLGVLDQLNREVGRRYASGEADPSEVLRADLG